VERCLFLIPLPIVLFLRWFRFDENNHWQTYYAVLVGTCAAIPAVLMALWEFGL
jgi:hypothetical protein